MPQAAKPVKWCLNKAKKEIEECKKHGKRLKHRGLLEIKPDIDEARKHIIKAEHNLKAISRFKEIGFSDWSIAACFYSVYHCFLAIAVKFGYESKNQACTIAVIEFLKEESKIDTGEKFIDILKHADMEEIQESKVVEMREHYTYDTEISVEDETKIKDLIQNCKEMVDTARGIVFK